MKRIIDSIVAQIIILNFLGILTFYYVCIECLHQLKRCFILLKNDKYPQRIRRAQDYVTYLGIGVIAWWCEVCLGMEIEFTGDVPLMSIRDIAAISNAVVVSNHISYIDWFLMFFMGHHFGGNSGLLRWIVKEEVLSYPILGWCMKMRDFIGMKRNFKDDCINLKRGIEKFVKGNAKIWLSIFPEGRFLNPILSWDNVKDSSTRVAISHAATLKVLDDADKFCEENGLVKYRYLLPPRWKGLYTVLNEFSDANSREFEKMRLIDLTVGFSSSAKQLRDSSKKIPGPLDLLAGSNLFKKLKIHLNVLPMSAIPIDKEENFKKWIYDLWRTKDNLLASMDVENVASRRNVDNVSQVAKYSTSYSFVDKYIKWPSLLVGLLSINALTCWMFCSLLF